MTTYRLDQHEKRLEAIHAQLGAISATLSQIQTSIAGLSTKDTVRGWSIGIIIALIATLAAVGGLFLTASGNQLSAFQAGLSAVQTGVAVRQPLP